MLLMLCLGNSSEKIATVVSKSVDNADFVSFENVDDMITQSTLRHYAFNRLIFSTRFIDNDEDMSKLCDFVRENMGRVEIVYLLSSAQVDKEDMFKEYFDSPLYTVMFSDSPTAKVMVDASTLSIADVKARYYSLDKPKKGTATSTAKNVGKSKKSFGGKQEMIQAEEPTKSAVDENGAFGFGDVGEPVANSNAFSNETTTPNEINSEISSAETEHSSFSPSGDFNSDDSFGFLSGMDLSIGDYGSQHSDSGFVGDDEMEELEKLAKVPSAKEEKSEPVAETQPMTSKTPSVYSIAGVIVPGKVNLVTGVRGSETSGYVINTALSASKAGKRVLVVDMDVMYNGILSYIDTRDFYAKGCVLGIKNKRLYNQSGIDFLSNGFNSGAIRDIDGLLGSDALKHYDVVLVDCPCEALFYISDTLFSQFNVVVCSGSDIGKLRDTSAAFYNRNCISLFKEAYISKCGKVANKNISQETIALLKSEMLFPNGCWLNNL